MWTKYKQAVGLVVGVILLFSCGWMAGRVNANQVAFVDPVRIMAESPKLLGLQTQLAAKNKELADRVEKQKAGLKPEELAARQQAAMQEYQQFRTTIDGQINGMVQQAVDEVSRERKLPAIFMKAGVASGGVDVTNDVLKKLQQ